MVHPSSNGKMWQQGDLKMGFMTKINNASWMLLPNDIKYHRIKNAPDQTEFYKNNMFY